MVNCNNCQDFHVKTAWGCRAVRELLENVDSASLDLMLPNTECNMLPSEGFRSSPAREPQQTNALYQHAQHASLLMAACCVTGFQSLLAELMLQMAAYSAVLLSAFAVLQRFLPSALNLCLSLAPDLMISANIYPGLLLCQYICSHQVACSQDGAALATTEHS